MRRLLPTVLLTLGALFTFLSVPAGYVNRTVLDAPTFAERVDELRRRDDVSEVLGREVASALLARNPDLIAVAPLVETVAVGVVGGDLLSPAVRAAAAEFNRALTTGSSDQLVLRIADAGAVVSGVIGALSPDRAPAAGQVSATLADIGSEGFDGGITDLADLVDTLAWLLPVLAVATLAGGILTSADRWDGLRRAGWAVVIAVAALAAAIVVGSVAVRATGGDERADVMVGAVWDVFVRPIWTVVGLVAVVGALTVAVGSGWAAGWSVDGVWRRLVAAPASRAAIAVRAAGAVALGLAAIVEPAAVVTLVVFVVGVGLVVGGIGALSRLAPERPPAADAPADPAAAGSGRRALLVTLAVALVALAGVVMWAARPPSAAVAGSAAGTVTGDGTVCNGHAELCDRTFDEVAYAATHNSMSVAGKPGWYLAEQGLDIVPQLDSGVRALLIDVWYGRDAGNGRVRTAARSYEEALQVARDELGPDVVDSALRVVDAVAPGDPQGEEALYLCHGLCETGATSFDATLRDIGSWLATHPDEVLTLFIEDHVDADDIGAAVEEAGLADAVYTPVRGEAFPTLGEMIRSGRRLVVMLESGDGRPTRPWLVNGFDFVQETPFTFPTVESFSCRPNRGRDDAPLLQINHWLSGFTSLVSDARRVNAADVLGARVDRCAEERSMMPNLIAVNYADIGDTLAVVDRLNGID